MPTWSTAPAVKHQVVEGNGFATSLDNLCLDDCAVGCRLLSDHLQPLAGVRVEPIGIDLCDIPLERLHDLLTLRLRERRPCRSNRQSRHIRDIEDSRHDRGELRGTALLTKARSIVHVM